MGVVLQVLVLEKIVILIDLLCVIIDIDGVIVIKFELFGQKDYDGNLMVLFDCSVECIYLVCLGLIGGDFLNYMMVFMVLVGLCDLGMGNDVLIMFIVDKGGVKLVKMYVFKCGSYVIDMCFDVINDGVVLINLMLYLELVCDGGVVEYLCFYSMFIGLVVYIDGDKFYKIIFVDIDKGKVQVLVLIDSGWVVMVQYYFVLVWILVNNVKCEYYVNCVDINFYCIGI